MAMLSMRLPDDLTTQLEGLVTATGRSKSFLAAQAIREYLERESWQIAELSQAVAEAEAGDFATDEALQSMQAKWRNAG